MCFAIVLILPYHWTNDGYACCLGMPPGDLLVSCSCIPNDRCIHKQNGILPVENWSGPLQEIVPEGGPRKYQPFVVSLKIPGYSDDATLVHACNGVITEENKVAVRKYNAYIIIYPWMRSKSFVNLDAYASSILRPIISHCLFVLPFVSCVSCIKVDQKKQLYVKYNPIICLMNESMWEPYLIRHSNAWSINVTVVFLGCPPLSLAVAIKFLL